MAPPLHCDARMKQTTAGLLSFLALSACLDDPELANESQEITISSSLLGQGYGWGGQATGGGTTGGFHYKVTSTADDGSCGTLRWGIDLARQNGQPIWVTFDATVFPASTKKAIWLNGPLDLPSNTTIDGRGSWVSLRRAYDGDRFWRYYRSKDVFECDGGDSTPIIYVDGVSNVIVTNLEFIKTYPLGTSEMIDTNLDGVEDTAYNLAGVDFYSIDAQCFGDMVEIRNGATEVWIDHSDFSRCGDECISVRHPAEDHKSEVTVSSNYIHDAWKGMLIGSGSDMSSTNQMQIAISVYQNRFVKVKNRQPQLTSAAGHVYNNVYEDYRATPVIANSIMDPDVLPARPDIVVHTRAMVEHNVFRAVSWTGAPTRIMTSGDTAHEDPVLWSRLNICTGGSTCTTTSSFPACNGSWYFPCNTEHRGNLIALNGMTYQQAVDRLRPLSGVKPTTANDVRSNYGAYSCSQNGF